MYNFLRKRTSHLQLPSQEVVVDHDPTNVLRRTICNHILKPTHHMFGGCGHLSKVISPVSHYVKKLHPNTHNITNNTYTFLLSFDDLKQLASPVLRITKICIEYTSGNVVQSLLYNAEVIHTILLPKTQCNGKCIVSIPLEGFPHIFREGNNHKTTPTICVQLSNALYEQPCIHVEYIQSVTFDYNNIVRIPRTKDYAKVFRSYNMIRDENTPDKYHIIVPIPTVITAYLYTITVAIAKDAKCHTIRLSNKNNGLEMYEVSGIYCKYKYDNNPIHQFSQHQDYLFYTLSSTHERVHGRSHKFLYPGSLNLSNLQSKDNDELIVEVSCEDSNEPIVTFCYGCEFDPYIV